MGSVLAQFPRKATIVAKRYGSGPGQQRGYREFKGAHGLADWRGTQGWALWRRLRSCRRERPPHSVNFRMRHAQKTDSDLLKFTHGAHLSVVIPIQGPQIATVALLEQMQRLKGC